MNNKGYMLIEIVLASALAFGIAAFIIALTLRLKNKNDDVLVSTLMSTDQAIITNKIMYYAKEEKEEFSCQDIKLDNKTIKYKNNIIDIINSYGAIKEDVFDNNGIITDEYCSNSDGKISINIPMTVIQMSDKDYDVTIDYKYKISDIVKPKALITPVDNKIRLSCEDNNTVAGYVFLEEEIPTSSSTFTTITPQQQWSEEREYSANKAYYLICKDTNGNVSNVASYSYWTEVKEHSFNIPQTGYYKLSAWGAKGGKGSRDGKLKDGGKGGYISGTVYLTEGTSLYINVGGAGEDVHGRRNEGGAGGYNGGGKGGNNTNPGEESSSTRDPAGGGGGASHIATQSGVLSSLNSNRDSVLIVAGGGGGGSFGYIGGGGGDSENTNGVFGQGAEGYPHKGGSGGGGGGYYGGKTIRKEDGKGYGGSSYTASNFTNVTSTMGNNDNSGKVMLEWYGESL